ncbi:VanW family protein [Candidatus Woesebacteria bacterium]|nr:VanW family protein [Candidatus Woesebacteria bacterium]
MKKKLILIILIVISLFISAVLFISANLIHGKIFPNFYISGLNVSSISTKQATNILSEKFSSPDSLELVSHDKKFEINTEDFDLEYDIEKTVLVTYSFYRNGNIIDYIKGFLNSLFTQHDMEIVYTYNRQKLEGLLSAISARVTDEPVYPSARIEAGEVIINPGDKGTSIDLGKLISEIDNAISNADFRPIPIKLTEIDPTLTSEQINEFRTLADSLKNKTIILLIDDTEVTLTTNEILSLLNYKGQPQTENIDYFVITFSQNQNIKPQNSVFEYINGSIKEFIPSRDGIIIDELKLSEDISSALLQLTGSLIDNIEVEVVYKTIPPEITTDQVNDLGIKELIAKGSSTFRGSISSRIHNIGVAADKFNGTLIKPGGILSFNNTVGDISELTGYQKAYVIKDGQTLLGDGGGVCQVSTTLFRAALNAGLPIIERRAHSYRVTYYEQGYPPGIDATVYAPTTDLKIKNNTPGHILIQTVYDPQQSTLDFEMYGTNDGRVVTMTEPVITSSTPPPEDLYIDDPTLPQGQIKQIDWKAWGAKVNFDYKVEKDGEVLFEKTFYSNFQPWQAKFLRGTAPVN